VESEEEEASEEDTSSDEGDTLQNLQKRFGVAPTKKRVSLIYDKGWWYGMCPLCPQQLSDSEESSSEEESEEESEDESEEATSSEEDVPIKAKPQAAAKAAKGKQKKKESNDSAESKEGSSLLDLDDCEAVCLRVCV
jgi:hypothetical protein